MMKSTALWNRIEGKSKRAVEPLRKDLKIRTIKERIAELATVAHLTFMMVMLVKKRSRKVDIFSINTLPRQI